MWTRGPEPGLAGYEVVRRETTSPECTHVIPVGDVTAHEVDLSKDTVFLGARAVGRSCPRGPVAFPDPTRRRGARTARPPGPSGPLGLFRPPWLPRSSGWSWPLGPSAPLLPPGLLLPPAPL